MGDKVSPEDDAMRAKHGVNVHSAPIHNDNPSIHDLLIESIKSRKAFGKEKYGTELQAGNGRDALKDMLDELIDAAVYTMKEIAERENDQGVAAEAYAHGYKAGCSRAMRHMSDEPHLSLDMGENPYDREK